ncbi:DinB family protein [Aquitalea sp. ASV15]|uniref:DinB family protein n=1 Tax=Aquitalea sp. ASV15 TaxID=2795104 RepID=UPI0018EC2A35|nr:DinB family protein [Aquitalea sp. ASV15]
MLKTSPDIDEATSMPLTLILNQLRYKQWADQRTLAAIAQIDAQAFPAELAFARQQLNHMVRVEEVFRARLAGTAEPHCTTNSDIVPTLAELEQRLSAANGWLQPYTAALPAEQLGEIIRFRFLDGKAGSMTRAEILFHLVNHGSYHRGAIGRALDMAGGLRPADTYTVFIHATEPARREG